MARLLEDKQPKQTEYTVPGSRLKWLKTELDKTGTVYTIEKVGKDYKVKIHENAIDTADKVMEYKAHGRPPPKKLSKWQRFIGFLQKQVYFAEEMVVFFAVLVALLTGVYFFGLGNLPSYFALLYGKLGVGSIIYVLRGVVLLFGAVFVLFLLNKTVGKPPDGKPRGMGTYRFLSVLLIGGLVIWLIASWFGFL